MGRPRGLGLVAVGAVCAGFAVQCTAAFAAAGFLPAETLAGAGDPSGVVATAMAPNGYAIAGWAENLSGGQNAVRVATRPPGGPWSVSQQLDVGAFAGRPYVSVAIDAAGAAAIAWDDETVVGTTRTDTTNVSTRAAGQPFTAPGHFSGTSPQVGI